MPKGRNQNLSLRDVGIIAVCCIILFAGVILWIGPENLQWNIPVRQSTPDFIISFSGSTGTYNTTNGRVIFVGLANTSCALIAVRVETFTNMTWEYRLGELVSDEWKDREIQKNGNVSTIQIQIDAGESRKFSILRYGSEGKLHSVISYFILESYEDRAVVLRPWVGGE